MDKSKRLPRVAAIHDLSCLGKCSLTMALPVISATGVECSCIPTAVLSTHTGEFRGYTLRELSEDMTAIARHWKSEGLEFDAIYSGYLASPEQGALLEEINSILDRPGILHVVDPVMADHGEYYAAFDDSMRDTFRRLCASADIITPNITEAALLAGLPYREPPHDMQYISDLLAGLFDLGAKTVALTGFQPRLDIVAVAALEHDKSSEPSIVFQPARPGVFYGTGDLFASALTALILRGATLEDAVELAVGFISESIENTINRGTPRREGVDFESAMPKYIHSVAELFGE